MVISRGGKTPSAQETFLQMAQAAGLRGRILVTLGLLLICRLGIAVPLPGIDRARFTAALQGNNLGGVISFLDTFSGGGLSTLGVFALGILPFINASIIIQLLTAALPTLEDLQKNEGEAGRRKIAQISRYVSLGWGLLQGTAIALWINSFSVTPGPIFIAQTVLALTAGSMFVMWVSELITERGVGNGASLLIFVNIVATLPKSLANTISLAQNDKNMVGGVVLLGLVFLLTIVGIIFIQEGTRRIPIVSARRQVGRRMYAEKSSYLPLRLNQGGVMPIIFSSTVLMLPAYLTQVVKDERVLKFFSYLQPNGPAPWAYAIFYASLILFFSYFYSSLIINPIDMAQNLKKMGSSIPGIRPGKATSEYVGRVLNRLTFLGALFLAVIAIIPTAVEEATRVQTFRGIGATSLLILVGVAIDTSRQIQTYVISQRYEGMVKQ
jgi:preprotein translocase subunit SecY